MPRKLPPLAQSLGFARDTGGFERRRCPHCGRFFKVRGEDEGGRLVQEAFSALVQHGNAHELVSPRRGYCVYCGRDAEAADFLTPAQREYLRRAAEVVTGEVRHRQLGQVEGRLSHNPYVTFVAVWQEEQAPAAPPEPDDMRPVRLRCCGGAVKLRSAWRGAFYCPQCHARHEPSG